MNGHSLTNRGLLQAALVVFALFLAYRFLAQVAALVLLLAAGLLLAIALSAPVEALYRRKVPRPVGVVLIVLVVLAALGLGGYLLYPTLAKQTSQLASSMPDAFSQLVERARQLANQLGIRLGGGGGISPQTLANVARRVLGGLLGLFSGLASFFTGLLIVLFVPLYLAALPGPVVEWVVRLFPPDRRDKTREILSESRTSLLGWLAGRLFSMVVVGLLSTAALYLIGVPGALLLGLFSGLAAFVPIIGSIVGAIPPRRQPLGRPLGTAGLRGDTADREQPPHTPGNERGGLTPPRSSASLGDGRGRSVRCTRGFSGGPRGGGDRGAGGRAVVSTPGS